MTGYPARRPSGGRGRGAYRIGRAQRPRAVAVARPHPPSAGADVRPAPYRLCPSHVKPQCKQSRMALRGVAHCCLRSHQEHPLEVAGAAPLSRLLQANWFALAEQPPKPLPSPPVWRRHGGRTATIARRLPHAAHRLVGDHPPDPHGIQRAWRHGGWMPGTGGEPWWLGMKGARRAP